MADMEPQRRTAVICLLGDLAAVGFQLIGPGGRSRGGLLTGVLLVAVVAAAARQALGAEPVDAVVGGGPAPPGLSRPAARWPRRPRLRRSTGSTGRCWCSTRWAGARPSAREPGQQPLPGRTRLGALRVLLAPSRPASGQPSTSRSAAPRRRLLAIASTPEGR